MNDNIKEILDNFKNNYDELGSCYYPEDILGPEDLKLLYDYITNLQEENEYSNHCNEELRKKITNLEYKIERLEEDNKQLKELCDKYEEEHSTTFIEWKKDIKANKKAIEYIGQHFIEEGSCEINKITGEYTCEGNENFLEELLDILKGDNK